MSWPWSELGLPGPADLPEIRRGYEARLKTTHPEDDPEGFQKLNAAYREASRYARRQRRSAPSGTGERGAAPEGGPQEADLDCGEPLEEEGEESGKKPDRDCGGFLKEEAPKAPPEEPDWDYERLFAEGEAEAQEVRRRKLEDLRWKNRARISAQEREQRLRAAEEEESWAAVSAAAHALELLYDTGAPLSQWRRFLSGPVFWNVRANLDFIFILEDFLEQHPELSPEIRKAVFSAYGFGNRPGYPVYKRLYKLLNVDRKERRRAAREKSAAWNAWRSYPPWRKACILACFSILAGIALLAAGLSIRESLREAAGKRDAEQWQVQSLEWLEEDLGEPFIRPLGTEGNLFAPESEPDLYFWVLQDGERSETWPGYRTDYPHIRIKRAMEDFAREWSLELKLDGAGGYSGNLGDAPGAYLFGLPLQGAEEAVSALGALADRLEVQHWYRVFEDRYGGRIEYQIVLCHKDLAFYDAISTQDGGFDAEEALSRYGSAGPAFCRYILEHSGLAEEHMGQGDYVLLDQEAVEAGGGDFFHVSGMVKEESDPASQYVPKVQYFLAPGGNVLFCLPGDGQVRGAADLYRGRSSHLSLEGAGLILVFDQTGGDS